MPLPGENPDLPPPPASGAMVVVGPRAPCASTIGRYCCLDLPTRLPPERGLAVHAMTGLILFRSALPRRPKHSQAWRFSKIVVSSQEPSAKTSNRDLSL